MRATFVFLAALSACTSRSPSSFDAGAAPAVPSAVFTTSDGSSLALSSYAEPGAASPHLLVIRVVAGWCGTCQWTSTHTGELVPAGLEARVRFLDVLLSGADNGPAGPSDLAAWGARSDGIAALVADPDFQLRALFRARAALPLFALVDARAMTVLSTLSKPAPEEVATAVATAIASLDGKSAPEPVTPALSDGRFARDEWDMIRAMALDPSPPPDSSNAVADSAAAAAFGKKLFFDGALSPKGVSCSSCHSSALLFTDGKETPPEGVGKVDRNVPTLLLAGHHRAQFWDGRTDSLWMQALGPIESPVEFGSSRLFAMHAVFDHDKADYESLFGALPPLGDTARFPSAGRPGDPAWDALPEADRTAVTRAFANVGKSIAAYERSLRPEPSALDAYAKGQLDALTDDQKDGLAAFFQAGCAQCHYGPRLTDDAFHNLRFPTGRHDREADRGRIDGIPQLLASEFNRAGPYSDDRSSFVSPALGSAALGAFKTPGLRGVGFTIPYGHGGSYWGLTSAIEAIRAGGLPADSPYAVGNAEPFLAPFDPSLTPKIGTFLSSLRLDIEP